MFGKLSGLFGGEPEKVPLLRALCPDRSINFADTFSLTKEVSLFNSFGSRHFSLTRSLALYVRLASLVARAVPTL